VFVSGFFKDHRKEVQNFFYFPMFILVLCLSIERANINWLRDRNGCSYNKLQKFIELDIRKQAINDQWGADLMYNPSGYRANYFFRDDFD
jgi:hypothetical protein